MNIDERCYGYEPAQSQLAALRAEHEMLKRLLKDHFYGADGHWCWRESIGLRKIDPELVADLKSAGHTFGDSK